MDVRFGDIYQLETAEGTITLMVISTQWDRRWPNSPESMVIHDDRPGGRGYQAGHRGAWRIHKVDTKWERVVE